MLRPIYSLGYLAYFQLNIDYIIEKYCVNKEKPEMACNGKCHLMKTLTQTETPEKDSNGILHITEAFFPVFLQQENKDDETNLVFLKETENNWKLTSLHPIKTISRLEQPPDFTV